MAVINDPAKMVGPQERAMTLNSVVIGAPPAEDDESSAPKRPRVAGDYDAGEGGDALDETIAEIVAVIDDPAKMLGPQERAVTFNRLFQILAYIDPKHVHSQFWLLFLPKQFRKF